MYCKTSNIVNKTIQYLNKSRDILKEHGLIDRFEIKNIKTMPRHGDDGEVTDYEVVTYSVNNDISALWLDKDEYSESSRYPTDIRDTIFLLLVMHNSKYYPENALNPANLPFSKEEIEILTLAGNFFIWDAFFLFKDVESVTHVDIPNMKLFSRNECYELSHMINLPRFSIGDYLPSFKIVIFSSEVTLMVIEPKEMVGVESNNPLIDYTHPYILHLTFGEKEDKDSLNEERISLLFSALDGIVISTDTNLRDLYFNAHQYLRITNIKEEKLVSIIVESRGDTTRYLGGLYSGFSMNTSRTEGTYPTLPFPNTRVSIGGQDVDLACSMVEIETALGLN